ncbi:alpha/beta fold hydrolase [Marinobacter halodurans]|uniref:Alpha/beta fold hydrolase n=1 Tax=Marinobacter halodurans TaxID=2528979 RepID=A0ABY1ZQ96_9GAMM|nr:alpha/beta fold hydrolase [Marinobacter halodurans]TBW57938.1 alpha/beta fold hydrolase [Marinobacter halodurans]
MATPQHIQGCGVQLFTTTRGHPEAPAVVLVHGYPDNQQVWDGVAERLARNWYVVTYDVRGAGLSDRPARTRDYRLSLLARDLEAVVDALLPGRRFHLVAHDWGSIQGWESVTGRPLQDRIASYTTLSGPCLDHVGYWMRDRVKSLSPDRAGQLLKQLGSSWYIFAFQLPWLAPTLWDTLLGTRWPAYLKASEGITEASPNPHRGADGRDGIRLYRANMLPRLLSPRVRYARCPVQLIVPTQDRYVGAQLFEDLHEWVPALYRREIDAGHWVPLSQPDTLARFIDEFARGMESGQPDASLASLRVTTLNAPTGQSAPAGA